MVCHVAHYPGSNLNIYDVITSPSLIIFLGLNSSLWSKFYLFILLSIVKNILASHFVVVVFVVYIVIKSTKSFDKAADGPLMP